MIFARAFGPISASSRDPVGKPVLGRGEALILRLDGGYLVETGNAVVVLNPFESMVDDGSMLTLDTVRDEEVGGFEQHVLVIRSARVG